MKNLTEIICQHFTCEEYNIFHSTWKRTTTFTQHSLLPIHLQKNTLFFQLGNDIQSCKLRFILIYVLDASFFFTIAHQLFISFHAKYGLFDWLKGLFEFFNKKIIQICFMSTVGIVEMEMQSELYQFYCQTLWLKMHRLL